MAGRRATLETFVDLRLLLERFDGEHGRVEITPTGAVLIHRARSIIGLIAPRMPRPAGVDVVVVAGGAEDVAASLKQLDGQRVQLLPLPADPWVARRVIIEAATAADAFGGAEVAERLIDIGVALNAERDPARVLEQILVQARSITHADAGSIYVVEPGAQRVRFTAAHNDSVDADFSEFTLEITPSSIVGAAILSKRTVRVDDLYNSGESLTHGRRFHHDRSFDERFNYQTRSVITTPMITPEGRVLAVIQLINARIDSHGPLRTPVCFEGRVRAFTDEDERLCASLAAQAATALENALLYAEIEALFEGFVRASVHAIEQRDPTTSGHSQRVADLTVGLAQAADRSDTSIFSDVSFSRDQLREIEYAGLLHDFGKVGVREEVLIKAKKLYPAQLELMLSRFDHMRTALMLERSQAQLAALRGDGDAEPVITRSAMQLAQLEELLSLVHEANEPTVLAAAVSERLGELTSLRFSNVDGDSITVVGESEIEALSIPRGTLTAKEREEIQAHVTHTYNFLVRIPWTETLALVPDIAGKHHEYLDGSGYPDRLPEPRIPLQARMMTVADIYDALTAADRPYKKAVPQDRALDILNAEAKRGKVDPEVLRLFIEARVFDVTGGDR